jgi:CDI immunity protein
MIREELNFDRADAWSNGDFVCIETSSYLGYYGTTPDPQGNRHLLQQDCTNESLGEAVIDALAHSRVIPFGQELDIYKNRLEINQRRSAWIEALMSRYGYKTKRALFKKMALCSIERRKGESFLLVPSEHESLEGWSSPRDKAITISVESSAETVGAALRSAFARCVV